MNSAFLNAGARTLRRVLRASFAVLTALAFAVPAPADEPLSGLNPLDPSEEAARMARMMGGAEAVRAESEAALAVGTQDDCAWALRLTDILLVLEPTETSARETRAGALRCLAGLADDERLRARYLAESESLEAAPEAALASGETPSQPAGEFLDVDDEVTMTHGDPWNVEQNFLSLAITDAEWTINEDFPGTKIIVDGRYAFRRRVLEPEDDGCDCAPRPPKTRVTGAVRAHLQWGEGETSLEYARVSLTALAEQRDYPARPGRFTTVRDMYEWGVVQGGKDDPLGVDYYGELTIGRFARTWARAPRSSPWWLLVGLEGSIGYSWSESDNEFYEEVSNPIIGTTLRASINRSGMGSLYLQQRVINGFGFSSPARSGAVSREARFRFGYLHRFRESCLALDLFVEKRSFNFSDPQLPDLYTKSKRTGLALGCLF
jgi:hypothetical protein